MLQVWKAKASENTPDLYCCKFYSLNSEITARLLLLWVTVCRLVSDVGA